MSTRENLPTRTAVRLRVLFLALLLVVPAGLAIKRQAGVEPYPAILLPSFGPVLERDGVVRFRESEVIGITADGRQTVLDPAEVMPGANDGYSVVFGAIFSDEAKVTAPDSVAWLRQQLARSYPDQQFTSLSVRWVDSLYDSRTGQRTTDDDQVSYTIDLQGAS
ncbi:hypothetical protein JL107_12800 [Nakamurella flavida]|uniref:Uncharacterized protein n=1 Tax=Nakamurella flavida TaxID=363630 RepID=A0A938YQZ1_9ACTN|nr:hypothetical protein [Nakamurella flavida]MBM9477325.1 hypothetical protein [Nakamurella flavida]MDP9779781.1 hypothetical protein [Nakamurella flavida]